MPPTTSKGPRAARVSALRILAKQRVTEAQLRARLERLGYEDEDVRFAVERCRAEGYVDDALFARFFVDCKTKAVGDARLVAELVRRGVARDAAQQTVASAERDEESRLDDAIDKLARTRSSLNYASAARALERLGFPASAIYRHLRERARLEFGDLSAAFDGNRAASED